MHYNCHPSSIYKSSNHSIYNLLNPIIFFSFYLLDKDLIVQRSNDCFKSVSNMFFSESYIPRMILSSGVVVAIIKFCFNYWHFSGT